CAVRGHSCLTTVLPPRAPSARSSAAVVTSTPPPSRSRASPPDPSTRSHGSAPRAGRARRTVRVPSPRTAHCAARTSTAMRTQGFPAAHPTRRRRTAGSATLPALQQLLHRRQLLVQQGLELLLREVAPHARSLQVADRRQQFLRHRVRPRRGQAPFPAAWLPLNDQWLQ